MVWYRVVNSSSCTPGTHATGFQIYDNIIIPRPEAQPRSLPCPSKDDNSLYSFLRKSKVDRLMRPQLPPRPARDTGRTTKKEPKEQSDHSHAEAKHQIQHGRIATISQQSSHRHKSPNCPQNSELSRNFNRRSMHTRINNISVRQTQYPNTHKSKLSSQRQNNNIHVNFQCKKWKHGNI